MKKYLFCMAVALLVPVSQADASNVGFSVGVNVGAPVAPVYASQPVVVTGPPEFVAPPQLGFYVAVGVPHDLFYMGGSYYLSRGNVWYTSPYYNGPWATVHYKKVPYGLRKHSSHKIHYYRDNYCRSYQKQGGHDYRHFRPQRHDGDRNGKGDGRNDYARVGGDYGRGGGEGPGHRGW